MTLHEIALRLAEREELLPRASLEQIAELALEGKKLRQELDQIRHALHDESTVLLHRVHALKSMAEPLEKASILSYSI